MKKIVIIFLLIAAVSGSAAAQTKKFLFDAAHYQTAGNADWVIDEDNHVAARYPTPLQSTINSSTAETYWTGAISSWGIKLVQLGHTVETLPAGTTITYGTSAAQDLQNYNVFIVDEPNSPFTAAERNALMSFVQNGGGLLIISDHNNADRNGDGWDALAVWNDLFRHSSYGNLPFGFKFDSVNVSPSSTNVAVSWSTDPILNGPQGAVSQLIFHNGATITMYQTLNPTVKGLIWTTGVSQGSTGLLCVSATYGTGRVFGIGDSSPQDDGTGSFGHTLYSSWLGEASGNHARLHLNASLWLAKLTGVSPVNETGITPVKFSLEQNYPNPFNPTTTISYSIPKNEFVKIAVYDELGREVAMVVNEQQTAGSYKAAFTAYDLASGVYYYRLTAGEFTDTKKMMVIK